ncbi:hypothetical protein T484DRAFT_1826332 [Baffinella frigidus]|nr:hypothetical protein T484DRAFT_1826332 [Cryptophyta sp. CCMP2293]
MAFGILAIEDTPDARCLRQVIARGNPVIANGGIYKYSDAEACLAETECDAVMAANALLTVPTLFANILAEPLVPRPPETIKPIFPMDNKIPCTLTTGES